jgi:hypothetical protein
MLLAAALPGRAALPYAQSEPGRPAADGLMPEAFAVQLPLTEPVPPLTKFEQIDSREREKWRR